jgi:hypothetical protein
MTPTMRFKQLLRSYKQLERELKKENQHTPDHPSNPYAKVREFKI